MTREEAISELSFILVGHPESSARGQAVFMAIEALEQIEAIEGIIDVPNTIIQEDVLKYKMIVDVVKGDWCEEKEPRGKEDEEK